MAQSILHHQPHRGCDLVQLPVGIQCSHVICMWLTPATTVSQVLKVGLAHVTRSPCHSRQAEALPWLLKTAYITSSITTTTVCVRGRNLWPQYICILYNIDHMECWATYLYMHDIVLVLHIRIKETQGTSYKWRHHIKQLETWNQWIFQTRLTIESKQCHIYTYMCITKP